MRRFHALALAAALATAAFGSEVVQLSPDTYLITGNSHAGIFANPSKLKMSVIREANTFAQSQGKIAIPLSLKEIPAGGPGHWPTVEYQFRVVDKGDPEAKRTALVPGAARSADAPPAPDLYAELTKLEDLRKRGILTDAEFAAQKAKLLNASK